MPNNSIDAKTRKSASRSGGFAAFATLFGLIIASCALLVACLALLPAFWSLISHATLAQTIGTPIQISTPYTYQGSAMTYLTDRLGQNNAWGGGEYMSTTGHNSPFELRVQNISDQTLVVSNRLPVRINSYRQLKQPINVHARGAGGGSNFRNYVVDIPPASAVTAWATFEIFSDDPADYGTPRPDFYTLNPGEIEIFQIAFRFGTPGIYGFTPGIEYTVGNKTHTLWSLADVVTFVPEQFTVWNDNLDQTTRTTTPYVRQFACTFAGPSATQGVIFEGYDCRNP